MRLKALHRFLCIIGTVFILFICSAGLAQSGVRVTLHFEKVGLQKIFAAIESQTAYRFVFTGEQLKGEKPVTISLRDAPLSSALEICFQDQPVTYSIDGNYLILRAKQRPSAEERIQVSGTVRNEKADPIAGVAIAVDGTNQTVTTDGDGNFILRDVPVQAIIICSGTNVETEQLRVNGQHIMNIILKNKINKLDDVQIIAYGTTTKRLNTGDVSTITSETIAEQPVSNTLAALEGRAPGLVITQNSGVPGSGFFVQIRGQNSIASGNNPLYVVDDVPYSSTTLTSDYSGTIAGGSPLSSLNPADVESVSVLKDADATSIYGSRGANGVILITTKRGKSGKSKVDLNTYFGFGQVDRRLKTLNTQQYLTMRNEAFKNDGATPSLSGGDYDLLTWDTTRYTDWQKVLIGNTSNIADVQLNFSGGDQYTQFILGGGYHRETTVFPGDYDDVRGSGHIGLNHASRNSKLRIDFSANYSVENNQLPIVDLVSHAMTLPPDAPPVYDSAGKLNWPAGFDNPYAVLGSRYTAKTNNLISHAIINYFILPEFQARLSMGYNNIQVTETQVNPSTAFNPALGIRSGNTVFSGSSLETWILEPQLEYQKNWGPGKLDFLGGMTFEQDVNKARGELALGFASDALLENIAAASFTRILNNKYSQYRYEALFARINYNIADRYILNLSARRDGSSRFGPGNQFANFGAIGIAWIFTKEKFVTKSLPFLSFGKLRSSYGTTGNDQIGNYQYLSTYTATPYPYQDASGLLPTNLYNAEYGWEINKKFEVGLELGMLNDRLLFSISYYNNHSTNQLVGYPLPLITGFGAIQENLPAVVRNTGVEFTFSYSLVKSNSFNWTVSSNLSIPNNLLVSFPGIHQSNYENIYEVGKPLSIYKSFEYLNVNPEAGIYQFVDKKGDATLSPIYPDDIKAIKKVGAAYYGGLQNNFQYKNWRLDIFFQFTKQTGWNYFKSFFIVPGKFGNQPNDVLNRWQEKGDEKPFQQFTQDFGAPFQAYLINSVSYGDNTISDASYIRLKNVSLSYSIPQSVLSKCKLQNARVYLQGQNLMTISNYLGMDPENQSNKILPPLRVMTGGIQITF